jgi:hypothetical protein
MNSNKQQMVDGLYQSILRYRKMTEETSDPIASRFLRDILVDLEAEMASLKVEKQEGQTGHNENSPACGFEARPYQRLCKLACAHQRVE